MIMTCQMVSPHYLKFWGKLQTTCNSLRMINVHRSHVPDSRINQNQEAIRVLESSTERCTPKFVPLTNETNGSLGLPFRTEGLGVARCLMLFLSCTFHRGGGYNQRKKEYDAGPNPGCDAFGRTKGHRGPRGPGLPLD